MVIAFMFPLVLFRSNLEHLINLGLHNLLSNSQPMCVNTGKVTVRNTLTPNYHTKPYHTSPTFSSTTTIPTSTQSFLTPLIPSVKLLGGTKVKQILVFIHYFLFLFNFIYYLLSLVLYFYNQTVFNEHDFWVQYPWVLSSERSSYSTAKSWNSRCSEHRLSSIYRKSHLFIGQNVVHNDLSSWALW